MIKSPRGWSSESNLPHKNLALPSAGVQFNQNELSASVITLLLTRMKQRKALLKSA